MTRNVWLCTRPLKAAVGVSPLESTSDPDRPHLRHWGILVTNLTELAVRDIINKAHDAERLENKPLGVMYELQRQGKQYISSVDDNFTTATIRQVWGKNFTSQLVGTTGMTDEEIREEGTTYVGCFIGSPYFRKFYFS
jgi:hypothetical protein